MKFMDNNSVQEDGNFWKQMPTLIPSDNKRQGAFIYLVSSTSVQNWEFTNPWTLYQFPHLKYAFEKKE